MVAITHAHTTNLSQAATNQVIVERAQPSVIAVSNLSWIVAKPGTLPANAIAAISVNGKSIYICNATAFGGVHPGQLTPKGCLITFNGKAVMEHTYKVLTGTAPLVWKDRSVIYQNEFAARNRFYGVLAQGMHIRQRQFMPVIGGYESSSPSYLHPLYICRALGTDTVHVGKVVAYNCNVAINGKEVYESNYQVLSTVINGAPAAPPSQSRALVIS